MLHAATYMILQNSFCRQCFPSCSVLAIPCIIDNTVRTTYCIIYACMKHILKGAVWRSALKRRETRREICPSERENDLQSMRLTPEA